MDKMEPKKNGQERKMKKRETKIEDTKKGTGTKYRKILLDLLEHNVVGPTIC